jgi:hypothetical protein
LGLYDGESAGSCAVSCAGYLGLIIVVAVVLVGIGILVGVNGAAVESSRKGQRPWIQRAINRGNR